MGSSLPSFPPFPAKSWRGHISQHEWNEILESWTALGQAYLELDGIHFAQAVSKDESIRSFVVSFVTEVAHDRDVLSQHSKTGSELRKVVFLLTSRIFKSTLTPELLQWEFLADWGKVYNKTRVSPELHPIFQANTSRKLVEANLSLLKKFFIETLDAGFKGDLKTLEEKLTRVNFLINASPDAAAFFMAGTDFVDGLVSCYKIMNPPLRNTIITTSYLCLLGLTEGATPHWSMLSDQLFSLQSAAEAHKTGPLNVNDSMVAELVTATPILKQLLQRAESNNAATATLKSRITALEAFRKPGGSSIKPKRRPKHKVDKGKSLAVFDAAEADHQMHIHLMSQISQVQDLFADLGAGYIAKLLDEYENDPEQVIAHLLDDSLPPHLAGADRSEPLPASKAIAIHHDMAPRPTPPQPPQRHNKFDDDDLDRLDINMSQLHFGKRNPDQTADDLLNDRSSAPNKAAILSALAAFDSDDDERDDTYDAADVGGTVDSSQHDDEAARYRNDHEQTLFRAYQASAKSFDRDAATRRSIQRTKLKEETGMTDEAIEGWAVMLSRDPQQRRRLEAKYTAFTGAQLEVPSTAWRASPAGSGAEDSDLDGGGAATRGDRGGRGGGRGFARGRGGGGRGGNVAGPTGDRDTEQARRRKEANKGSRANHNRREGRARKMARAGFPG